MVSVKCPTEEGGFEWHGPTRVNPGPAAGLGFSSS